LEPAFIPKHRHQRQNEIGLIELLALTVNPNEDICDLFGFDLRRKLKGRKGEIQQRVQFADRNLCAGYLVRGKFILQGVYILPCKLDRVRLWVPDRRYAWDERFIAPDRGIRNLKAIFEWIEGDLNLLRRVVLAHDRDALDDRIEGGQTLLTINNYARRSELLVIRADLPSTGLPGFPKEQIADRIPAIHRVEKLADFDVFPDERALDIRETDLTVADRVHQ
jgi:hypothetical protein